MKNKGFTYIEVLISLFLLLTALLFVGSANMTSIQLLSKGKINQRATLLLLNKIEELKNKSILELAQGTFQEPAGIFEIHWQVTDHTPYFGTKQIRCRILHVPSASIVVETIFYRSE